MKSKLLGNENANIKELVENKKVYDEKWLTLQRKISRIFEIEDLLKKYEEIQKNRKSDASELKKK